MFNSARDVATRKILVLLSKGSLSYGKIFSEIRYSHSTIQISLKFLIGRKLIGKDADGHYEIVGFGTELLNSLQEIEQLMKG